MSRFVPTKRAANPYMPGTVEWHDYRNKGVFGNFIGAVMCNAACKWWRPRKRIERRRFRAEESAP